MSILLQIFGSILALLAMIFVLLPLSLLCIPFKEIPTKVKIIAPGWWIFSKVIFIGSCTKVHLDDRRKDKKYSMPAGLYIINHQSIFDIPLSLMSFIIPPIMKKQVLHIPIFGLIAKACAAIPVDRKDPNSRKKVLIEALRRLGNGISLLIYPEGSRSKSDFPKAYEDIKKPIINHCYNKNIQVVPVSIYGTRYLIKKGKLAPFKNVAIITHEEVFPKDFNSEEEFSRHVWSKVCEGHKELYDKYHLLNFKNEELLGKV